MPVASVYPAYVNKVERKGRSVDELNEVFCWLAQISQSTLEQFLADETTFADFFGRTTLNPNAALITGSVCGVKVQEVEDPLMKKIRYLDKLVDELAKGRPLEKILRTP